MRFSGGSTQEFLEILHMSALVISTLMVYQGMKEAFIVIGSFIPI
jgi:hypothetical protein